jgi:thiol-disulfide isomerase/thioredoxin
MSSVAYHFWSPTCAPCKTIKPSIEDMQQEFNQVKWVSVNTHEDSEALGQKYKVSVVPTIVVVSLDAEGVPVLIEKHSGTTMMGYYRILKNSIRLLSK